MDIVEFVMARLAEDEQIARDAGFSPQSKTRQREWTAQPSEWPGGEHPFLDGVKVTDRAGARVFIANGESRAIHAARQDPERILAEVAAKRQHLELWRDACERRDRALKLAESKQPLMQKAAISARAEANGLCEALGRILLLDARIYAAHPDYNPPWSLT